MLLDESNYIKTFSVIFNLISSTKCLYVLMSINGQMEISDTMFQLKIPYSVFVDLSRFISENYRNNLPNSLLIAQSFVLKYQDYGREFGLSAINYAIEEGIKHGLF